MTDAHDTAAPLVLRDDRDGVAWLRLNRPQKRNALSLAMLDALAEAVEALRTDRDVRVVVLAAEGPVFCAGHDLVELRDGDGPKFYRDVFDRCSTLMQSLHRLPQPVIASVHGMATAAGCQLVASCDVVVAGESARFATPGVNIGLFCSTPMVALSRVVAPRAALEMLLTGDAVDAATAHTLGLVNHVVADDALAEATAALASRLSQRSRHVLALGKEAWYAQLNLPRARAYDYTTAMMVRNMMADDAAEGISAFLERRPPQWKDR